MRLRRGMMRWHIMYNLVVLRLISFGMDLHWARQAAKSSEQLPLTPPQQASADQPSMKASMKVQQPEQHAGGLQSAAKSAFVPGVTG
jgi:protein-cysteine N-palmitoyltransferase HHAT